MEVISMYMESISGSRIQQQAVSAQTTQTNQGVQASQAMKTSEQSSTPRAAEAKKTESTDGVMDVQIAKDSDESVTLSIQADRKQFTDDQKNVNLDKVKKMMEQAVASLPHSDAKFGIHEKTNRIVIKLVDRDTQEVIKEIPPEKTLDLLAKRMELAGVLIDERM